MLHNAAQAGLKFKVETPIFSESSRHVSVQINPAFSDNLRMEEARNRYFSANGFIARDHAAPTYTICILGISLKLPNTEAHKRAVPLHDLHHILTGFGNNWIGEAEIGAWELRAGCSSFTTYFRNFSGVIIGLLISPRRVWRAFRSARGQRSLYYDPVPYNSLLQLTVGEIRARLGIGRQISEAKVRGP